MRADKGQDAREDFVREAGGEVASIAGGRRRHGGVVRGVGCWAVDAILEPGLAAEVFEEAHDVFFPVVFRARDEGDGALARLLGLQ